MHYSIGYSHEIQARVGFLTLLQAARGVEKAYAQEEFWDEAVGGETARSRVVRDFLLHRSKLDDLDDTECDLLRPVGSVLESLAEMPLEAALSAWDGALEEAPPDLLVWEALSSMCDSGSVVHRELRDATAKWASGWNLGVGWMLDHALQTLACWNLDKAAREHRLWGVPAIEVFAVGPPLLLEVWPEVSESKAGFKARSRRLFDVALDVAWDESKKAASDQGFATSAPRYRVRTYVRALLHAVLNRSWPEIRDGEGLLTDIPNEARIAVRNLLALAGLRARDVPPS